MQVHNKTHCHSFALNAYLLHKVPETIDERAINREENLNLYQKTENVNLVINAAKSIGCHIVNVDAQDILEGLTYFSLKSL
jgi:plastin-1